MRIKMDHFGRSTGERAMYEIEAGPTQGCCCGSGGRQAGRVIGRARCRSPGVSLRSLGQNHGVGGDRGRRSGKEGPLGRHDRRHEVFRSPDPVGFYFVWSGSRSGSSTNAVRNRNSSRMDGIAPTLAPGALAHSRWMAVYAGVARVRRTGFAVPGPPYRGLLRRCSEPGGSGAQSASQAPRHQAAGRAPVRACPASAIMADSTSLISSSMERSRFSVSMGAPKRTTTVPS